MHEIPDSLKDLQHWFAHVITSPILESDADHIPLFSSEAIPEIREKIATSPTLKSEERLGIYQQQYWWRLIGVMQDLFPSLVALFDYEEFNRLIAEPYLVSHIPQDWFISNIGADLPEWIKTSDIQKELPVSELATLDLAYEQLLFADILPPIDPSHAETEKIYLQPFVILFELDADLFSFRKQLFQKKKRPLKKWRKKRYLVLYRLHEGNHYEEIQPNFFQILSRLQKGATLEELIPLLRKCEDVTALFRTMSSRSWLTLSPPKEGDRSISISLESYPKKLN